MRLKLDTFNFEYVSMYELSQSVRMIEIEFSSIKRSENDLPRFPTLKDSIPFYLLDESAGIIWGRVFFEENFEFYRSHETFVQPKKFCLNHMRKNFHLCIYRQQWHQVVYQILFQPNWKYYKYDFRIQAIQCYFWVCQSTE